MMKRPFFSLSGWLLGGLCSLILINFGLICFISAADILLGQPPQLTLPLFALLIASSAFVLNRRVRAAADEADLDQTLSDAPAYLAMTVIRRAAVTASPTNSSDWTGVIQ